MKIALVGAFDRNNYGDILMPIVLEKRIKEKFKNVEFYYYGLSEANMQYIKGRDTKNVSELYNANDIDVLILVGGEVLTSRYTNMYLNLQKNKTKIFILKKLSKIFKKSIEAYCKKELNGKESYPWIIDKEKVGCKKIIYNTVGGKKVNTSDEIKNIISKFDYISAREEETYKIVKTMNDHACLYPDSVISLSKVIKDEELFREMSTYLKEDIDNLGKYYVLQVKNAIGRKIIKKLVKQIKEIYLAQGLKCVLLPIGYAQGHEDQIVLRKIYEKLTDEAYFVQDNNIYDTAYVIKNAKAYVGTSLHGTITAISYNVPHMALTKKIPKLNYFLETWKTTPIINTDENNLSKDIKEILSDRKTREQLNLVREIILNEADKNFKNIEEILEGVKGE